MKRTFKNLLAVASLAIVGIGSFIAATPANAAVSCPKYPIPLQTTYPLNGHIYNCMPTPRNSAETTLQASILNNVNVAVAAFQAKRANDLNPRNIDIQVSYTAADSYAANQGLIVGEPPSQPGETGRSWVLPNHNPPIITNPTTTIFVFTVQQWNAVPGSPKIPTTFNSTQLTGTVHHELGHQFDRIWAQKQAYAPTASATVTNNTTNTKYISALTIDAGLLVQADIDQIKNNWPWMLDAAGALRRNEFFAEQVAINANGGATPALDIFINAKFRCSTWYVTQMFTAVNNAAPVNPPSSSGTICNHVTTWP